MSNLIKKILVVLISVIFILLILEILMIIYISTTSNNSSIINEDLKNETEYLFALKKNLNTIVQDKDEKFIVKTNSLGIRESQNYTYLDESIIILGDSVIFGQVNQSETIDFFIEEIIKVPTLNFGVGGFNTWQEYEFIKDRYNKKFNTKILILGICVNDIDMNYFRRAVGYNGKLEVYDYSNEYFLQGSNIEFFEKKFKFFLKKSELIKFIYYKVKSIYFGWTYGKKSKQQLSTNYQYKYHKDQFDKYDIDLTIEYVDKIKLFSEKNNIEFFVTILPHKSQFTLTKEQFKKISVQTKLENILESKGIKVISTSNTFFELSQNNNIEKYWRINDDIHPNSIGNKIIANDIAIELKKFLK